MKKVFSIGRKKTKCLPLVNLHGHHAAKYRLFRTFLEHNHNALGLIADLEHLYYSGRPFSLDYVKIRYEELLEAVWGVIYALDDLSAGAYPSLAGRAKEIDSVLYEDLHIRYAVPAGDLTISFEKITQDIKNIVGAKAANLASLKTVPGLSVPEGFAVTAYAYQRFMEEKGLFTRTEKELTGLADNQHQEMEKIGHEIQSMIHGSNVPHYIADEMLRAYESLESRTRKGVRVAMRSSAMGEDTEASFAGQFSTVLNVGREEMLEAYKTVLASKYSAGAISYRLRYGLEDREVPMCVACVEMIDPSSSGVIYTADPLTPASGVIRISSVWGLGESLVDGSVSPDIFVIDRESKEILRKEIGKKACRLVNSITGGIRTEEVAGDESEKPSITDEIALKLANHGLIAEEFFKTPQDIEWTLDKKGTVFILQSRPLLLKTGTTSSFDLKKEVVPVFHGGETASGGVSAGEVFIVRQEKDMLSIPENAILVTKTASPVYAKVMGRIKGLITDVGSAASHIASVAREFGVPAIVNAHEAASLLSNGDFVTMSADTVTVYKGVVNELFSEQRPARNVMFESPLHRRMKSILDRISPLTLTDTSSPSFTPEGCKTLHDIIRFTHEQAMKEMFGITEEAEAVRSVQLTSHIPLQLRLIDLGGGLRSGLSTCNALTPEDIESVPMKAIWKGFTHPGISWEGTINFSAGSFMTLLASGATSEFGEAPGGLSYAILSGDYMNLSAKFGYHFATIDSLCSEDSSQNYITIQFAGGAGNYYGRTLRVHFLGRVLERLGFHVNINGDLINASVMGNDTGSTQELLDNLGRLLASSRLMDMVIAGQGDIDRYTNAFFSGDYDFLSEKRDDLLEGFYTHGGYWKKISGEGRYFCMQDGSRSGYTISSGVAGVMGKLVGKALQDFLDNIEAYYYFPIAIARDSEMSDGIISVKVKPAGGNIDRAGGLAFGIRDVGDYFVLRLNALEDNVILFEFMNNRRVERAIANRKIESGEWHLLSVEIKGNMVKGYFNGEQVIEYTSDKPVEGFAGLWTKADSVTYFDELVIEVEGQKRSVAF